MKQITDALQISRPNLIRRIRLNKSLKREKYKKSEDEILLPFIREICASRPSYGYKRTTAILNRKLHLLNRDRVNHKRIYRIMRNHGLVLPRTHSKVDRSHDGRIVTLRSNLRWCGDIFEIKCWNGERVRVAFVLDCCDREIIHYIADSTPLIGKHICDLLVEAVEKRFGKIDRLPNKIEWLSDNGPQFTSHETIKIVSALGLAPRRTPPYSPESNGMAESFVKTFKRDYVYLNDLETADAVMSRLETWFEDYNEFHPHKGLNMVSPREFRRNAAKAENFAYRLRPIAIDLLRLRNP